MRATKKPGLIVVPVPIFATPGSAVGRTDNCRRQAPLLVTFVVATGVDGMPHQGGDSGVSDQVADV